MKKVINYLTARPALFFLLAALIWGGVMYFINTPFEIQWKDIFVEADGMVFDLLVFGALLAWYEGKRQENERVEQEKNLINDFRGWNKKEAMFRIVGAITRLNQFGLSKLDLSNCFLKKANLRGRNLEGANLFEANLQSANLSYAKMCGASLSGADLRKAQLVEANLINAMIEEADMREAILNRANLEGADLHRSNLQGACLDKAKLANTKWYKSILKEATFLGADLQGADLEGAIVTDKPGDEWFKELERWETKGIEEIKRKYRVDEFGSIQLK